MAKSEPTAGRRGNPLVRCAVYTRKSSEEGLEQDFNSLHAQREACEAYIKSQKHEGWVVLPAQYDDGGISGATMDRPALQQLLADIRARRVDTVVVYKVDRLTRSLADFAKIVEIFDAHGVAFVSVTQHFNTTSSMGRLTLNVLLSFAQFEREVAGERIRYKIAASKQRGMWMGGNPPLGYDVRDRKLVVNEAEAETVRHIFHRYVALRSVRLLAEDLADAGITSKRWLSSTGHQKGGQPLARGALYLMLQNRIYLGEIVHKDRHYPGQQAPIVDQALWDQAHANLVANAGDRRAGRQAKEPSLLAGLIFDDLGNRMKSNACREGWQALSILHLAAVGHGRATQGAWRISDPGSRGGAGRLQSDPDPARRWHGSVRRSEFHDDHERAMRRAGPAGSRPGTILVRATIVRATSHRRRSDHTDRSWRRQRHPPCGSDEFGTIIQPGSSGDPHHDANQHANGTATTLTIPVQLQRVGKGSRLIVGGDARGPSSPNGSLIRLLARAHQLQQQLLDDTKRSVEELIQQAKLNRTYATLLLRLSWLAPEITEAILQGRQPPTLTADKLARATRIPLDWRTQREVLGFR